jgi:hypothetical protein
MGWIEEILEFLRKGPKAGEGGRLDMNALFQGAVGVGQIDRDIALVEINALIKWQEDRKRWHLNKTRQKMAAEGTGSESIPGSARIKSSDFGLDEVCAARPALEITCISNPTQADIEDLAISDASDSDEDEAADQEELDDPIAVERRRRSKKQDQLRRTAGEPVKPEVTEILKLTDPFVVMLRYVLAD